MRTSPSQRDGTYRTVESEYGKLGESAGQHDTRRCGINAEHLHKALTQFGSDSPLSINFPVYDGKTEDILLKPYTICEQGKSFDDPGIRVLQMPLRIDIA